ncbi:MAG: GIY-YIG nuclease family protein [Patescibacteria group bacterium]
MKGIVYILQDKLGRYYIGSTVDIDRRMKQHKACHTATTKRMQSPRLVLKQEYASIEEARRTEARLKKLKRKDYIEKIVAEGYIRGAG